MHKNVLRSNECCLRIEWKWMRSCDLNIKEVRSNSCNCGWFVGDQGVVCMYGYGNMLVDNKYRINLHGR